MLEQQSLQAISEQYVNNMEDKVNQIAKTDRQSEDVEPLKSEILRLQKENAQLTDDIKKGAGEAAEK